MSEGRDWKGFLRDFLRTLFRSIGQHHVKDQAAQLAFWALLALFPFTIFLLTIAGYLPLGGVAGELMSLIHRVMPGQAAELFEKTIYEVVGRQRSGLLVISLLGWVWSAAGGLGSTAVALNRAWRIKESRPWWRRRVLAMLLILGSAATILIAVAALLAAPQLVHKVAAFFGLGGAWNRTWAVARWPVVVLDLLFLLACLYHFLPDRKQPFQIVTPGAVVAIGLWLLTSAGFNLYVRNFKSYAKTYGALGGAVVLMFWLFFSGFFVILGAEVNAAIERTRKLEARRGRRSSTVEVLDTGLPARPRFVEERPPPLAADKAGSEPS
jgi:membrane protein